MEPTASHASTKIIAALIIGLLVGFAAGVFWQDRRTDTQTGTTAEEATDATREKGAASKTQTPGGTNVDTKPLATSSPVISTAGSLTVTDQPAGDTVEVMGVDADYTVWVAVRELKSDGSVGNILGAQKVFTGRDQNVTVYLLRSTTPGNSYRIVLYREAGMPTFDHKEDILLERMEADFTAQ